MAGPKTLDVLVVPDRWGTHTLAYPIYTCGVDVLTPRG